MEPAQLLEDLRVIWIALENASVGRLGRVVLCKISGMTWWKRGAVTYIFLLFMHVSNLEPDVLLTERLWWVRHNVAEALWSCQWAFWCGRRH